MSPATTRVFLSVLLMLFSAQSSLRAEDARIYARDVPARYQSIFQFFQLIERPHDKVKTSDESPPSDWPVTEISKFISPEGIRFSDVQKEGLNGLYSKPRIQQELERRKGPIFEIFNWLCNHYSMPYKQYSELSFQAYGDKVSVVLGDGGDVRLVFRQGGLSIREGRDVGPTIVGIDLLRESGH
jgi:hypothetical protein